MDKKVVGWLVFALAVPVVLIMLFKKKRRRPLRRRRSLPAAPRPIARVSSYRRPAKKESSVKVYRIGNWSTTDSREWSRRMRARKRK
jgi:hypothetical protein